MKLRFGIICLLILMLMLPSPAKAAPVVVGKAAVLMDMQSGQILYSRNADQCLPMASTTKIMTVLVAMEKVHLTDIAVASEYASRQEGTSIYLQPGEKLSMQDIYYAILLNSANDAAVVVAEHVSGNVEKFAGLMNEKAKEIGAKNTNFVNPNGLPDPNHYTTASDLALITRYAMQEPLFRKIVGTVTWDIPRDNPLAVKRLRNHNRLLTVPGIKYEGATGVKTGYTRKAQQCLVASAARGSQEMLAVILGSQGVKVYNDATNLLDYGFANYKTLSLAKKGQAFKVLSVNESNHKVVLVAGDSFFYSTENGITADVTKTITINPHLAAPLKKGQKLGEVVYKVNGATVGTVPLVAQSAVDKNILHHYWWAWIPVVGLAAGFMLPRMFLRRRRRPAHFPMHRISWLNKDLLRK